MTEMTTGFEIARHQNSILTASINLFYLYFCVLELSRKQLSMSSQSASTKNNFNAWHILCRTSQVENRLLPSFHFFPYSHSTPLSCHNASSTLIRRHCPAKLDTTHPPHLRQPNPSRRNHIHHTHSSQCIPAKTPVRSRRGRIDLELRQPLQRRPRCR